MRVGHPARLLPQVLDSALDAQVYTHIHEKTFGHEDVGSWICHILYGFAVHSDFLFWSINATVAFFLLFISQQQISSSSFG